MKKAFTLIELCMVIVILGILVATVFSRFVDVANESENSYSDRHGGSSVVCPVCKGRGVIE